MTTLAVVTCLFGFVALAVGLHLIGEAAREILETPAPRPWSAWHGVLVLGAIIIALVTRFVIVLVLH